MWPDVNAVEDIGTGEFRHPVALCAHPNGNLLVLEACGSVQEVTWTGDHVRFICAKQTHVWEPCGVDVSPDGALIAVVAYTAADAPATVELLNERTRVPVKRLRIADTTTGQHALRFGPDGGRVAVVDYNRRPTVFSVHGDGDGTMFGAVKNDRQHVEFTDECNVVVATDTGATVYSSTSLEPVRSWAWRAGVRLVLAIKAHRGLLYVLLATGPHENTVLHVYE